jgi:hypothetical protein
MKGAEPAAADEARDRTVAEAEPDELTSRHDAVLRIRQRADRDVRGEFCSHSEQKSPRAEVRPLTPG